MRADRGAADGNGLRRLTGSAARDFSPAWSPDGSTIVFARSPSESRSSLYTVRADGGGARPLTRGRDDSLPAWSPDGAAIAFHRGARLAVIPAHGGTPRGLARSGRVESGPSWSPDGAAIAFEVAGPGETQHVEVVAATGGSARRLVVGGSSPDWSPDGRSLA